MHTIYITAIENVQRRATKLIPNMKNLTYEQRLKKLNLPTLTYRRLRGDMIETYKMLTNKYDEEVNDIIKITNTNANFTTRGHSKKLFQQRANKKIRQNFFSFRIVKLWNSLPERVISAPSVQSFERRLDNYWKESDVKFDFRADTRNLGGEIDEYDEE